MKDCTYDDFIATVTQGKQERACPLKDNPKVREYRKEAALEEEVSKHNANLNKMKREVVSLEGSKRGLNDDIKKMKQETQEMTRMFDKKREELEQIEKEKSDEIHTLNIQIDQRKLELQNVVRISKGLKMKTKQQAFPDQEKIFRENQQALEIQGKTFRDNELALEKQEKRFREKQQALEYLEKRIRQEQQAFKNLDKKSTAISNPVQKTYTGADQKYSYRGGQKAEKSPPRCCNSSHDHIRSTVSVPSSGNTCGYLTD